MSAGVVIVGGGQAGLSAAAELRKRGYDGPVTMVCDEPTPPYQRPPLSKAYLSGELPADRLWLKPEAFYAAARIDLKPATRAQAIDRAGRSLILSSGERLAWDHLILATGGQAKRPPLPGAELKGVHVLRTLVQADALSDALKDAKKIAILGAGYIGLEVAASARKRGLEVAVVEAADRPMARTASPLLGGFFGSVHRGYGVELMVSTPCLGIVPDETGARAAGLELPEGERIEADLVLLATGLTPDIALAEAAGLPCEDGILVDHQARTEDAAVFAIGDVARFHSPRYGRSIRLESVQNAIEQGKAAAQAIVGMDVNYDPVPWFWSDQYALKLQIAGLVDGADQLVRRGDPEEGRFAIFHLKQGRVIACEAVDSGPEYMAAQRMIERGVTPDPERLRSLDVAMREFLA
jgi:3-phenylpropionate/trans-cinnamate dioxygenase ferredoxin reductase component